MRKAVVITSGGGDSIANGLLLLENYEVHYLHVSYGQKCELGERLSCQKIAGWLLEKGYPVHLHIIYHRWLGKLGGSGLTDRSIPVPNGLVSVIGKPTIYDIFTPARNVVLIATAASIAEAIGAEAITLGCNQSEVAYLDNTHEFLDRFTRVLEMGCLKVHPKVFSPEWELDKVAIYKWYHDNGFGRLLDWTWSCDDEPYKIPRRDPSDRESYLMCGRCGCCRNRRITFLILNRLYGITDNQSYKDEDWFWREFLPIYVELKPQGRTLPKWFDNYYEVIRDAYHTRSV